MADDVVFQVLVLPSRPWPEFRDQVLLVEALGFDGAAFGDHFCDWANPPAPWMESWTLLGALAAETSSVRLVSFVTQIPLRNPGVLAHQAVTVDQISGGRLEVGLGSGLVIDPGEEMIGLPNWSPGERTRRFAEYIELVGLLLSQDITTYDGDFYSARDAVMNPSSVQRPRVPMIAAALGPKMMEHTARFADGWNTMSFSADFDEQLAELRERNQQMDELCTAVGRDPSTLRRGVNLFDAEARGSGGRIRYYDDTALFTDLVGSLRDAGYTEFSVYFPSDDGQRNAFQQIAGEIIPGLR